MDNLFLETLELLYAASQTSRNHKLIILTQASGKLGLLKSFLQFSWDLKALDTKKYLALSQMLDEVGRMLGGWIKLAEKETPQKSI